MPEFEPITGRYITIEIAGEHHRIFVEEAGSGIPLALPAHRRQRQQAIPPHDE